MLGKKGMNKIKELYRKYLIIICKKISAQLIKYNKVDTFCYQGERLKLYENRFNCGKVSERMTERGLELAIAERWLNKNSENVIEVGAVTPYYFRGGGRIEDVVDPCDKHKQVSIHDSLFNVSLKDKNVLCISTVEHVGLNEYGVPENRNSVQAIKYIFQQASSCMITYPIGHNKMLDDWTKKHLNSKYLTFYTRNIFDNEWKIGTKKSDLRKYGPLWANTVVIINK